MSTRTRARNSSTKSLANEVLAVLLFGAAVLLMLSLVTYDPLDPSWNATGFEREPNNVIGVLGAYLSDVLLQLFGLASLVIPVLMVLIALRTFRTERLKVPARKTVGSALLLAAASGFLGLFEENIGLSLLEHSRSNGGAIGYLIAAALEALMNKIGAAIVLLVSIVLTLMLTMEVSLATAIRWIGSRLGDEPAGKSRVVSWAERLSAWWALQAQRRNQSAELRRLEKAEESRRRGEELLQLRREEHLRHQEEDRLPGENVDPEAAFNDYPTVGSPSRTPRTSHELVSGGGTTPGRTEATPLVQPGTGSFIRREAAAAVRAYESRTERLKSSPGDVTMDPEVAEMISTASIVRKSDDAGSLEKIARGPGSRRRSYVDTSTGSTYEMPSLDLLETPIGHKEQAEEELRERATILAEKCKEFAVTGHIHRINPGPVVTTFEFKPDPGIKYSRVVSLADDLCLALKAESIRIDRIPGKSTVGIEVPNHYREKIFLRDVIESAKFQVSASKLTVALGKTINGEEYVADLAKMPHLLIAGATGAGKSMTLNAIICSILYKASPDQIKFIMVDPKRVELGLYEGIPHLLTPIVTDPKRASNALKWAVNETENRYRELAKFGVRNIEQYNRQVREMTHPTLFDDYPDSPKPIPYIVIAIDELADLMMVARGEVETSIARLAQMARAVGIHLVLATQRPSVDIITGVIKANIPSRIAFRVSSKVDSRTIIDSNGAEALLGQGDMLFLPPGTSRLIRVHGSYVNEIEVKRIADHTKKQAEPDYNEQVTLSELESEGGIESLGEHDELYEEALAIVTDMGRASTSVLQRRLSIGYGRAAKILDMMEREGFVGAAEGAKPRKVLPAAYEFRERLQQQLEDRVD